MTRSIPPSKYDRVYFERRYQIIDYTKLKELNGFDHIYRKAGSMLELGESDKVVDLGCGTGQLAFYLYRRYNCFIAGIDYSEVAINFSKENLSNLKNFREYEDLDKKVSFLWVNNDNLSDYKNIRAVFLVDVLEHLNNEEVELILDKIKRWKPAEGINLVIHTDNNNYLKFVRPVTDFISVCLGKTSFKKIKEGEDYVMERHINLTTANRLIKKLTSHGFEVLSIEYPTMGMDILKNHIGPIGEYRFILYAIYFLGKLLYFLRPSFYMLAKYG